LGKGTTVTPERKGEKEPNQYQMGPARVRKRAKRKKRLEVWREKTTCGGIFKAKKRVKNM